MIKKYAVVDNGVVENIIKAQPDFKLEGKELIEVTENNRPHIGLGHNNGIFEQPVDATPLPQLKEQKISEITKEYERRLVEEYPLSEQRNIIIDVMPIDPGQSEEYDGLKTKVNFLRAKSSDLEASINTMGHSELKDFNVPDDSNWT